VLDLRQVKLKFFIISRGRIIIRQNRSFALRIYLQDLAVYPLHDQTASPRKRQKNIPGAACGPDALILSKE
jgi:hypothetical protein